MIYTYCKYCRNKDFDYIQEGQHCGQYCKKCGKWQKWVSKDDIYIYQLELILPKSLF